MAGTASTVTLRLPATLEAPARARQTLTEICRHLPQWVVADATLLTSELVSNSVKHAGGPVVVAIECDDDGVSVEVADPSPDLPIMRDRDADALGGRGMHLVAAIAREWGCRPAHDGVGKSVWFALAA